MTKPFYKKRRFYALTLLLLAGYFCLVPSCPKNTPEATGIDAPTGPDGLPDYFAVFEQSYFDKLSPPEDNGQRLLIAACGPSVLEQNMMAQRFSWDEISGKVPSSEPHLKNWFEKTWIPLCEHMNIDPYEEPEYLRNPDFFSYLYNLSKEKREVDDAAEQKYSDEDQKLWDKLSSAPWKAEDHPEIAAWVKERSPVLDLFGVAVRKPNFVCWRKRAGGLWAILLPDVQANRAFIRDLRVRVTERLGRGDTDGAIYDAMSIYYLGRKHFMGDPIFVVHVVGVSCDGQGFEAARQIFKHGNLTAEQLERFAVELAALPKQKVINTEFEHFMVYDVLQNMRRYGVKHIAEAYGVQDSDVFRAIRSLAYLPFDLNLANQRVAELGEEAARRVGDSSWKVNPRKMMEYSGVWDSLIVEKKNIGTLEFALSVPLIRTRSRLMADQVVAVIMPSFGGIQNGANQANTNLMLLQLAIALERYKIAEGNYPQELKNLVPKYLDEIPLEPSTGRKSWIYKPEQQENAPFLLYAFGPNGKDDKGVTLESLRGKNNQQDYDLVW